MYIYSERERERMGERERERERERETKTLVRFLYLMTYQPSWIIQCQIFPYRRTVGKLFNPLLRGGEELHFFPKGIYLKMNVIARLQFEIAYYDVAVGHLATWPFENR